MRCPHCAAQLPDGSPVCAACGRFVETVSRVVRCELTGNSIEVLGWMLLFLVSAILVIPMPWTLAAFCRWFCRHLELSDGTTTEFTGTGDQIIGWWLLYIAVTALAQLALFGNIRIGVGIHIGRSWSGDSPDLFRSLAMVVVSTAFAIPILRWALRHVQFSSGVPLDFVGEYHGLLGWCLLYELSFFTIIGWAWVLAAIGRWIASNTKGENLAFEFHGEGHQILWRTIAAVLLCLPIATIPWAWLWFHRWIVRNVTLTRGIHAEDWVSA